MSLEAEFNAYRVYVDIKITLEELEEMVGGTQPIAPSESLEQMILSLSKQFMDVSVKYHEAIVERIELEAENAGLKAKLINLRSSDI